ncbi:MAG: carbohydrate kinase [Pirellulaceae bacterium]|nr:carbohydrate kinase [Pirellulaceae bacterium]
MNKIPIILGLGEVLWDVYPDASHFGGAPANFACHASALGANSYMVSAVGDDELGKRAAQELVARNVHTEFLSIDRHRATGTVNVLLDELGKASYHFASNTAWDHLRWDEAYTEMAAQCDAVCFGTLAQRSPQSCQTVLRFVGSTRPDCLRIFDVNLRQEFYSRETIVASMQLASVLKLNEDELPVVARLLEIPNASDVDILNSLCKQFEFDWIALTRGANGSVLYSIDVMDEQRSPEVKVIDTVGAGDAFTAALVVGLLNREPIASVHRFATEIAAYVCTQPGATPALPKSS